MADVWLGILNRFVEKYLNVKGGPTVVDFNHAVHLEIPVLIGVEERFHQGWNRFGAGIAVTGAAGQAAAFMLHNPVGSNAIAVIERFGTRAASASNVNVSYQQAPAGIADYATVQTPLNLDGRLSSGTAVSSVMAFTSSTAGANFAKTLVQYANLSGGAEYQWIVTENQEITLPPASAIQVVDAVLAEALTLNIIWRERPLEPSELA